MNAFTAFPAPIHPADYADASPVIAAAIVFTDVLDECKGHMDSLTDFIGKHERAAEYGDDRPGADQDINDIGARLREIEAELAKLVKMAKDVGA